MPDEDIDGGETEQDGDEHEDAEKVSTGKLPTDIQVLLNKACYRHLSCKPGICIHSV